jgi:hypothetical protein
VINTMITSDTPGAPHVIIVLITGRGRPRLSGVSRADN